MGETFYANREETGGVCQLPTFVYYVVVEGEGFKYRLCTAPFAFTHQLTKSLSVENEIVSDELNTLSSVLSTSRQTSAIGTATTT